MVIHLLCAVIAYIMRLPVVSNHLGMLFWGGGTLMDIVASAFSLLLSAVGAALGLDCMGSLYSAYRRACMRLEDEKWLLENCRDPTFFSKMRAHPTVCNEVETNARIGAFWTALKEVTDVARVAWQPYMLGFAAAVLIFLPVCWLCAARASSKIVMRRRRQEWGECIPMHGNVRPVCQI
jgi:hypothetical protein